MRIVPETVGGVWPEITKIVFPKLKKCSLQ